MVVIGVEQPGAEVRLTLRYDLPDPGLAPAVAAHAMSVLTAQRIQTAVAVGYGPEHLVSPVAAALRDCAPGAGVTVTELLRAENQRYWSYVCEDPACCPPEGKPFDVRDHPAARAMAAESARVLASRDALAATVAPVTGAAAGQMRQATKEAEEQVARAIARAARSGRKASVRRLIATVGLPAVSEGIRRYRGGRRLEPEEAAWLTVVLRDLRVRDDAWSRMRPEHREAHTRLWTDLTRLAQPGYVCAPAALLAFVAWQSGNGALANVALDRALAEDANYSMAVLLRQVIDSGAPPSLARLPMTPEDVAASYDALDRPGRGQHRNAQRLHAGDRARAPAVPACWARVDRRSRAAGRAGRACGCCSSAGPARHFSERDRALLTLLRPHLHQAYLDAAAPPPGRTAAHPPALGSAAPGCRRAHQQPGRPPPRRDGGNRAQAPGKRLRQAARLQPHRRRHPRLPRPGHIGTDDPAAGQLRRRRPGTRPAAKPASRRTLTTTKTPPQQVRRDAAARRRPDTLPEPFVPFGTQLAHFALLCASL